MQVELWIPNCKGPFNIAENSKKGTLIHDFIVKDPDKNQISTMKATLVDTKSGGILWRLVRSCYEGRFFENCG